MALKERCRCYEEMLPWRMESGGIYMIPVRGQIHKHFVELWGKIRIGFLCKKYMKKVRVFSSTWYRGIVEHLLEHIFERKWISTKYSRHFMCLFLYGNINLLIKVVVLHYMYHCTYIQLLCFDTIGRADDYHLVLAHKSNRSVRLTIELLNEHELAWLPPGFSRHAVLNSLNLRNVIREKWCT